MTDKPDVLLSCLTRGKTCFATHMQHDVTCQTRNCRMWMDNPSGLNCTHITIMRNACGPMTLQQIGDIHGLTRMRVCQIEKRALVKLRDKLLNKMIK